MLMGMEGDGGYHFGGLCRRLRGLGAVFGSLPLCWVLFGRECGLVVEFG